MKTLQLMAPAIRADSFAALTQPLVGSRLDALTVYTMRRDFERDFPDWRVDPAAAVLARQGIDLAPLVDPEALVLRTDLHGTDSFYAVRWLRPA